MEPANAMQIEAAPAKEFFVNMLTKDIGIVDCILDLIDNSVDKAVHDRGIDVTKFLLAEPARTGIKSEIRLSFGEDYFEIVDTSGGISIAEARDDIFRFGNPGGDRTTAGLSVYGVGMKRAMFKLGRVIDVESFTTAEQFSVHIDVDEWLTRPADWHFEFRQFGPRQLTDGELPGTTIRITRLNESTRIRFSQPSFVRDLTHKLATSYGLFLKAGLALMINGEAVSPEIPEIASDVVDHVRRVYHDGDIDILVIAGVTTLADKAPRGWYVFCNGRMIVEADKTSLTGWGDKFPQFHSKYNHFLGFLYFRSDDVWRLPWNTTKQSIDRESLVYQRAIGNAQVDARPIITFLNRLYPGDVSVEDRELERQVLAKAKTIPIDQVQKVESRFSVRVPTTSRDTRINIQYKRSRELVERIRKYLGHSGMGANKIGEHTFDYFVKKELSS